MQQFHLIASLPERERKIKTSGMHMLCCYTLVSETWRRNLKGSIIHIWESLNGSPTRLQLTYSFLAFREGESHHTQDLQTGPEQQQQQQNTRRKVEYHPHRHTTFSKENSCIIRGHGLC